MRRARLSQAESDRVFRASSGAKAINSQGRPMRGGWRL